MKLQAKKQMLTITMHEALVSGSVNIYKAEFEFDNTWDGYDKIAVFSAKNKGQSAYSVRREVLLSENSCVIPWEVLEEEGKLKIGVYGVREDKRLPTIYTDGEIILDGAAESCRGAEPTPQLYEQLLTKVGNLDTLKTEDKSSLVAAINEIWASVGGGSGGTVTDAAINEDGHLIITLSTGKAIDAGYAVGPAGANGKSAYQYAQDGGYTGTESEFAAKLAAEIPTVDDTLTKSGAAADAAAVGEKIQSLSEESAAVYDKVVADVIQLKEDKLDKPATPPDSAGKVLRVLSVNEDGTFTCEWADDGVGICDVTVDGKSIVQDGVANVPKATNASFGVVQGLNNSYGIVADSGYLKTQPADSYWIDNRFEANSQPKHRPLVPAVSDLFVKAAMCDGKGPAWTAEEQAAARDRIGIDKPFELIEEIVCDGEATAYTRTVDVNGNPYNLLSVYIEFEIETGNSYTSNVFFRAYDAESNTVLYDGSLVNKKNYVSYLLGGVYAKNGMYQGWMINGNIASYNGGGSNAKRINRRAPIISPIKKIHIMVGGGLKFLSGDKIRIYGVRA